MDLDFGERCIAWYSSLTDDAKIEVRSTVGVIPDWMVVSLGRAGIPVISVEVTNGHTVHGYLMPTALMVYLSHRSDASRP